MDAVDFRYLMLIKGGLRSDKPISSKSSCNRCMPLPINNEGDLKVFVELHCDVLGGCRLRLEAHRVNVFTDPHEGKKLTQHMVFKYGSSIPQVWLHQRGIGPLSACLNQSYPHRL
ncbi:hypothetical protein EV2_011128 [Malus domestica]